MYHSLAKRCGVQSLSNKEKIDMRKARLFFIDNLRILLIALVIMVHLSVTYGGVGGWY